jgi:hypothetical protein
VMKLAADLSSSRSVRWCGFHRYRLGRWHENGSQSTGDGGRDWLLH